MSLGSNGQRTSDNGTFLLPPVAVSARERGIPRGFMRLFQARLEYVERLAPGLFRWGLVAEGLVRDAGPGQFYMVRVGDGSDPLLRRPFALHRKGLRGARRTRREDAGEILFQVVGRGTRSMAKRVTGDMIDIFGPMGRGWRVPSGGRPILVAGGMGVASLVCLAQEMPAGLRRETVALVGAKTRDGLWCVDDLEGLGMTVFVSVEQGQGGFRGSVLDLLQEKWPELSRPSPSLFVCGPAAMVKAVALWAEAEGASCQASLESSMGCGTGVCLGCGVKARERPGYVRVCKEGPVFDAGEVDWGALDVG